MMHSSFSTWWLLCLSIALCAWRMRAEETASTRYVDAGMNVTLSCRGQKSVSAVILWALNGTGHPNRELLPDARHSFTRSGDLVIRNVLRGDEGLYTCHANSTANRAMSSILLEVQDITLELRILNVSKNSENTIMDIKNTIYVQAGSLVQFSGRLLAGRRSNQTVDWTLNGSSHYLIRPFYCWSPWIQDNTILELNLFSAHAVHSGRYTFHAGTLAKSVDIQVIGYAPRPNDQYFNNVAAIIACSPYVPPSPTTALPTTTPRTPSTTTATAMPTTTVSLTKSTSPKTSRLSTSPSTNPQTNSTVPVATRPPSSSSGKPINNQETPPIYDRPTNSSEISSSMKQDTSSLLWPIVASACGVLLLAVIIIVIVRRRKQSRESDSDPRLSKVCEFFPAEGTSALGQRSASMASKASYGNQSHTSNPYNFVPRQTPLNRTPPVGVGEGSTPLLRPSGRVVELGKNVLSEPSPTPPVSWINPSAGTPPLSRVHQRSSSTPIVGEFQRSNSDVQQPSAGQEPYKHRAVTALQEAAVRLGPSPAICRKCSSSDEIGLDSDSDMDDVQRVVGVRSKDDSAFGLNSHSHRRGRCSLPARALHINEALPNERASSAPTNLNASNSDTHNPARFTETSSHSDSGFGSYFAINNSSSTALLSQAPEVSPKSSVEEESFVMSKNEPLRQLSSGGVVYEQPWNDYDSVSSDYTPEMTVRRKNAHRSRRQMVPNPRSPPTDSPPDPHNGFFTDL